MQKYIVRKVKLLATNKIIIPILSICHSHQAMILIENKYTMSNKNIKKTFINVNSQGIKTIPKFRNTNMGKLFKTNYNKTKKLYHSHKLALDSKYKIKKANPFAAARHPLDLMTHQTFTSV